MSEIKDILLKIVATATITGGLVVGFQKPEKLTFREARLLRQVYTYEIRKAGGIRLTDVNQDNLIEKLQAEVSKRVETGRVKIGGEYLESDDYMLLRSGLFKKALNKSLIEKIL